MRGEPGLGREIVEVFQRDAEDAGRAMEVAVAHRSLGLSCLFRGEFAEAQTHLEQALRSYDPERDREAMLRFGQESSAGTAAYLAQTKWMLGDVGRARQLMDLAVSRAAASDHVPTQANTYTQKAMFEALHGDAAAAARDAGTVVELCRQHGIPLFLAMATVFRDWASVQLGDRGALEAFERALASYEDRGNKLLVPLYKALRALIEAEDQSVDRATTRIDEALALASETGERWTDALLHRIRGEILLQRDPANTAPAEEAFLTAIAVAQQQKAKSFELRAVLSLAKLYRSTGRAADAHAVLAPILEGFSPTAEFPEIAEAQSLLGALAQTCSAHSRKPTK
jgi:predicted ATPase